MDADSLIKVVTGTGGFFTLYKLITYIFENLEKIFKEDKKKLFGGLLATVNLESLFIPFIGYVLHLVDSFFSPNHLSWKCFWKSLFVSLLFVIAFHFWFFFFYTDILQNKIYGQWLTFLPNIIIFFAFYNSIDYLLLWKTRKLLVRISKENQKHTFLFLVGDLIVTFLFASLKFVVLIAILTKSVDFNYFFNYVVEIKYPPVIGSMSDPIVIPSLFFWATFLYSGFLWLYCISIFLISLLKYLDKFKAWLQIYLDIENNPFAFIRIIFVLLLLLIFLIIAFIRYSNFDH